MIDIDDTWKLTQGQGHGVKGQGQIGSYLKNCFVFKTRMDDSILMKLIYIVDVDKQNSVDIWSRSRGQRSRSNVQLLDKLFFRYKPWTDDWILMILTHKIDIPETVKLTQGQGQKVKGQGHRGIFVKK